MVGEKKKSSLSRIFWTFLSGTLMGRWAPNATVHFEEVWALWGFRRRRGGESEDQGKVCGCFIFEMYWMRAEGTDSSFHLEKKKTSWCDERSSFDVWKRKKFWILKSFKKGALRHVKVSLVTGSKSQQRREQQRNWRCDAIMRHRLRRGHPALRALWIKTCNTRDNRAVVW